MTRGPSLVVGVLCVWQLVGGVALGVACASRALRDPPAGGPIGPALLIATVATLALGLALMAFFAVHAIRSPALGEDARVLWLLLLFLGGPLVLPAYWWRFFWRGDRGGPTGDLRTDHSGRNPA